MQDRYRALRAVTTLLRILAWIVAVFGALFMIGAAITTGFDAGDPVRGLTIVIGGLLAVGLQALVLFAASALLTLLMDIEQNTRATAEMVANATRPY